jgi:hypothetical protein
MPRLDPGRLGAGVSRSSSVAPKPTMPPRTASPIPTPSATLHLSDPASADLLYTTLNRDGFGLVGTSAQAGTDPLSVINATYAGQPLIIEAYSSGAARARLAPLVDGAVPAVGQPLYTFAGLNIVVFFGPTLEPASATLDPSLASSAATLVDELDRLIGPLVVRSPALVPLVHPSSLSPTP